MLQLIIALIVIAGLWAAMRHFRRLPDAERKRLLWRWGLWGGGFLLILMVATGRAHWLFAILGALMPLAKTALGLGLQLFPMWQKRRQAQQASAATAPSGPMSVREAMDTLGLKGDENQLSRDAVISAHRKLIQKLHPDRGGNDFLAAKVNEAKELLLNRLS